MPGTVPSSRRPTMLLQNHELSRLNISIRSNQLTKMPVNSGTMIAHRNGLLCDHRSEEHTSELQSLMRISYAVFCLKKKQRQNTSEHTTYRNTQEHISTKKNRT